jgi:hypothetical protein
MSRLSLASSTILARSSLMSAGVAPPTPLREEQPRLDLANFYYSQEDELYAAANRDGFTWSVHRPRKPIGIIGGFRGETARAKKTQMTQLGRGRRRQAGSRQKPKPWRRSAPGVGGGGSLLVRLDRRRLDQRQVDVIEALDQTLLAESVELEFDDAPIWTANLLRRQIDR